MQKVAIDFDVCTVVGVINESRDNRFAVIGCQLFELESYFGVERGKQAHILSVWDVTDVYNSADGGLLEETVRAEHPFERFLFDTIEDLENEFTRRITARLVEIR